MDAIDELRRLAPPPGKPSQAPDWDRAERELGVSLPPDYRILAEHWGAGTFDGFLQVFAPGHPNRYMDLLYQAGALLDAYRELAEAGEELPYAPRIAAGGLLPWGSTDNGDTCFWHMSSEDPSSWEVVVNEARGPDWGRFEGGVALFLASVLSGREQFELFPEDWPSGAPSFIRA